MTERILYFECNDGISGDMTLGALIDLGVDVDDIKRELDKFVPEPYDLVPHQFARNGITGTNLDVLIEGEGGSVMTERSDDKTGGENIGEPRADNTNAMNADRSVSDFVGKYNFVNYNESRTPDHGDPAYNFDEFKMGGIAHSHEGHTHTRSFSDIKEMIEDSEISGRAKVYAIDIFRMIAEGESKVHGLSAENVTFHEVGAMDSIIDIVGTAIAIDILDVSGIFTGVLHDGSGTIRCQHGIIPVPVPAVMEMSKDAGYPIVIHEEVGTEMITPTGFGIIKGLGAKFNPALAIVPERVGYGFGKRNTGRLGAVRITLGVIPPGI